jgi:hypothetical protein
MNIHSFAKCGVMLAGISALVVACAASADKSADESVGKTDEALTAACGTFNIASNSSSGVVVNAAAISGTCWDGSTSIYGTWTSPSLYGSQVNTGNADCPNQWIVELDNARASRATVSASVPTINDPTTCANTQVSLGIIQNGNNIVSSQNLVAGHWVNPVAGVFMASGCIFGDSSFSSNSLTTVWPAGVSGSVRIVAAAQTVSGTSKGQTLWADVPVTVRAYAGCPPK